jgi:hypothetical protein
MRILPAVVLVLSVGASQAHERAGSQLRPGIQLHFASTTDRAPQEPWTVESVRQDTAIGGRASGTVVVIRTRPQPAAADVRMYHLSGDTLSVFDAATSRWQPSRPVGPGMTLELPRVGGGLVRYTTSDTGRTTISGVALPTVLTTVTTIDSTGRAVRRLTEQYSLSIASAVEGTFEVADSTSAGGWRVVQQFALRRLESPPGRY